MGELSSTNNRHAGMFDGSIHTGNDDWNSNCWVKMKLRDSFVGQLDMVKYYISQNMDRRTYFIDHLKFQGSHDDETWEDLAAVDQNVHPGWNQWMWEALGDKPKFQYYRFKGDKGGSCLIREAELLGKEIILDDEVTKTCPPMLTVDGTES
jgi:hypothetical protein